LDSLSCKYHHPRSQWGDEGKGKIVDLFSDRFDIVARYQGGHNAGHTVFIGLKKFILKLIPSGILRPGKRPSSANGLVLDPAALLDEIDTLEAAGVDVTHNLAISNRAHVLFPQHRMMERMSKGAPGAFPSAPPRAHWRVTKTDRPAAGIRCRRPARPRPLPRPVRFADGRRNTPSPHLRHDEEDDAHAIRDQYETMPSAYAPWCATRPCC